MKRTLKILFFTSIFLIFICVTLFHVLSWFEVRKWQSEQLEKLVEITQIPEFKCMRVLYYYDSNSRAIREFRASGFVFFSPKPSPYFSGVEPQLKVDARTDRGASMRRTISKAVGNDIGKLKGSIYYFRYLRQGHQLDIAVSETKDGFYIKTEDIWAND